ncbi:hypothetical protein BJ170DRAFT_375054 [Xylariales sp. AK1849]|nr:hypothetical protein BJ170DRAFT_375054 [Xylariales sp. AK1849]
MMWDDASQAYAYNLWVRDVTNNGDYQLQPFAIEGLCGTVTFLFPGAWNFEFCVSAFNGTLESERSACVMGPKDISDGDQCEDHLSGPSPPPDVTPTVSWSHPAPTSVPTVSPTPTAEPTPEVKWAEIKDPFVVLPCGDTCTALMPVFTESQVRKWCQGLVDDV